MKTIPIPYSQILNKMSNYFVNFVLVCVSVTCIKLLADEELEKITTPNKVIARNVIDYWQATNKNNHSEAADKVLEIIKLIEKQRIVSMSSLQSYRHLKDVMMTGLFRDNSNIVENAMHRFIIDSSNVLTL